MRADLIRLWSTVALAGALAIATVDIYRTPAEVHLPAAGSSGALLFQAKGCSGCHTIAGVAESASVGPNLTNLNDVAGERIAGIDAAAYVNESIREPQAFTVPDFPQVMPTLAVSDTELELLVEFLLTER